MFGTEEYLKILMSCPLNNNNKRKKYKTYPLKWFLLDGLSKSMSFSGWSRCKQTP